MFVWVRVTLFVWVCMYSKCKELVSHKVPNELPIFLFRVFPQSQWFFDSAGLRIQNTRVIVHFTIHFHSTCPQTDPGGRFAMVVFSSQVYRGPDGHDPSEPRLGRRMGSQKPPRPTSAFHIANAATTSDSAAPRPACH